MTDTWTDLVRTYGPQSVVNPNISAAELDRITHGQIETLRSLIQPLLTGTEILALDYGCGAGRLTPLVADLVERVIAYDPCPELIALAPTLAPRVVFTTQSPRTIFEFVFVHGVLGEPNLDVELTALHIGTLLAPDALLIVVDHMPEIAPAGTWWTMRRASYYQRLFGNLATDIRIPLLPIGTVQQLDRTMTVLAGRKQPC